MATRTICFPISGYPYCREQPVTFTWIKGSKRQNIRAVHDAVHTTDPDVSILEVSSASVQPEGEAVSSLRLFWILLRRMYPSARFLKPPKCLNMVGHSLTF